MTPHRQAPPQRRTRPHRSATARRATVAAWVAATSLLAACPTPEDEPAAVAPVLEGAATSGFAAANEFSVRGARGAPRSASFPVAGNARYQLPLGDLQPPYLLRAGTERAAVAFHAIALAPGRLNATPLTELVAAYALGEPPRVFYDGLAAGTSAFAPLGPADLAQAEQRVRAVLVHQLGLALPASLGPWDSASFAGVPGEPMTDALRAMGQRLADSGRLLADLTAQVATEAQRCRLEALALDEAEAPDVLCPAGKQTGPDAADPAVTVLGFVNGFGDALSVQVEGGQVRQVSLQRTNGRRYACSADGCNGVSVGTPAADGSRQVDFAATELVDGSGLRIRLRGRLQGGQGEVPAPCTGAGVTARSSDGSTRHDCVLRRYTMSSFARTTFTFTGRSVQPWWLHVQADGGRVAWVSVALADPSDTTQANQGVRWRCRGDGCAGATLGDLAPDGTRRLTLAQVQLERLADDGSAVPGETTLLNGVLEAAPLVDPPVKPCEAPPLVDVANADGGRASLCGPSTIASVNPSDDDGDGVVDTVWMDLFDEQNTLWIGVSRYEVASGAVDGVVLRRRFVSDRGVTSNLTVQYRCSGAECAGLSFVQDGDAWIAQFDGVVLREVDPAGDVGERSVTLQGRSQ